MQRSLILPAVLVTVVLTAGNFLQTTGREPATDWNSGTETPQQSDTGSDD